MEYKHIIVSSPGKVGTITLNSPNTANALSKNMIRELIDVSSHHRRRPGSRGHRDKGQREALLSRDTTSPRWWARAMVDYKFIFEQCSRMMTLVQEVPKPVIAGVHGVATAAGVSIGGNLRLGGCH